MKKIIFLIIVAFIIYGVSATNDQELIIPDTSIRLRVIPNSNQPLDIHMKEQVKTYKIPRFKT